MPVTHSAQRMYAGAGSSLSSRTHPKLIVLIVVAGLVFICAAYRVLFGPCCDSADDSDGPDNLPVSQADVRALRTQRAAGAATGEGLEVCFAACNMCA